jgi:hypothetical protein
VEKTLKVREEGLHAGWWSRPEAGFVWRYAAHIYGRGGLANQRSEWPPKPPSEIEPLRREGDESYLGPWLLPADLSMRHTRYLLPRRRRLVEEFLELGRHPQLRRRETSSDPGPPDIYFRPGGMTDWLDSVKDFADRYGWLGTWPVQVLIDDEPPDPIFAVLGDRGQRLYGRMAEFRHEWEDRIREVRDLWELWDAARRAENNELLAYEELENRIEWASKVGVPFVGGPNEVIVSPRADLIRVVFAETGMEPEPEWRVGACRVRYGRRSILLQGWRDRQRSTIRPNKSTLVTAAHLGLSAALAEEMRGMITVVPSIPGRQLSQVPDHLMGAIYLQLAQEFVGAVPRLRWRPCEHCGSLMVTGRRDKRFCSNACRYAANYSDRTSTTVKGQTSRSSSRTNGSSSS